MKWKIVHVSHPERIGTSEIPTDDPYCEGTRMKACYDTVMAYMHHFPGKNTIAVPPADGSRPCCRCEPVSEAHYAAAGVCSVRLASRLTPSHTVHLVELSQSDELCNIAFGVVHVPT
jgi:hypothetical protein